MAERPDSLAEQRARERRTCGLEDLPPDGRELVAAAAAAREHAHAPYSHYAVGAAVRMASGEIIRGCNVEISSYGLTMCAERVALFAARAGGGGAPEAIAVVGPGAAGRPTPPCGACRQVIWELAGDVTVLLAAVDGAVEQWSAAELLPSAFGPDYLNAPDAAPGKRPEKDPEKE